MVTFSDDQGRFTDSTTPPSPTLSDTFSTMSRPTDRVPLTLSSFLQATTAAAPRSTKVRAATTAKGRRCGAFTMQNGQDFAKLLNFHSDKAMLFLEVRNKLYFGGLFMGVTYNNIYGLSCCTTYSNFRMRAAISNLTPMAKRSWCMKSNPAIPWCRRSWNGSSTRGNMWRA